MILAYPTVFPGSPTGTLITRLDLGISGEDLFAGIMVLASNCGTISNQSRMPRDHTSCVQWYTKYQVGFRPQIEFDFQTDSYVGEEISPLSNLVGYHLEIIRIPGFAKIARQFHPCYQGCLKSTRIRLF